MSVPKPSWSWLAGPQAVAFDWSSDLLGQGKPVEESLTSAGVLPGSREGSPFSSLTTPGVPGPVMGETPRAGTDFFASFPSMAEFATDPQIREQYRLGQGPFSRLHQSFTQ